MTPEAEQLKDFIDKKFVNYGRSFLGFVLLRARTYSGHGTWGGSQEEFIKRQVTSFMYKNFKAQTEEEYNSLLEEVVLEYGHGDEPEWN